MILISGASGLVGTHSTKIRALYHSLSSKERALKNLVHWQKPEALEKIEWVQIDITDIPCLDDVFKNIEQVYHCAGFISSDESKAEKMRKINIEGTANMVNLALNHEVKKFCHVSSIAALGSEINDRLIDEDSPRNNEKGHSSYALSKFGGEMEVWRASEEGLNVVIVNPGVILGIGNWQSGSGRFFSKIDKGVNFHLPKVSGFVAAEDVARAMVVLMEKKCSRRRFILVSENCSIKNIMTKIAEALGKKPPQKALKPWMVVMGWVFQTIAHTLWNGKKELTRDSAKNLFEKDYYSSKRIEQELNFQFRPIDKVIDETAEVFLEQKGGKSSKV